MEQLQLIFEKPYLLGGYLKNIFKVRDKHLNELKIVKTAK